MIGVESGASKPVTFLAVARRRPAANAGIFRRGARARAGAPFPAFRQTEVITMFFHLDVASVNRAQVARAPKQAPRAAFRQGLAAIGFVAWAAGIAQAAPLSVAECAAIAADSERLACYDRAAGRAPAAKPEPPPAAAAVPVLVPSSTSAGADGTGAPLIDAAWGFDPASDPYVISFYHQNYLLFGRYSDNVNNLPLKPLLQAAEIRDQGLDSTEAKFQISFKARLWTTDDRRWGAWAAYTQQNQWQVYNGALSSPFRETNYMPEAFVTYRPEIDVGDFRLGLLKLGFNHQSNGRSDPLSRSWNRVVGEAGFEKGNLVVLASAWYRINESSSNDDNPDITDYYGYGQIQAFYRWRDNSFTLTARGNPSTGKGAAQFTWTTPRFLGPLRGYVQAFSGYGESMIDYNWRQNTIGIGISLNDEF
jgi:phospholipase A1